MGRRDGRTEGKKERMSGASRGNSSLVRENEDFNLIKIGREE